MTLCSDWMRNLQSKRPAVRDVPIPHITSVAWWVYPTVYPVGCITLHHLIIITQKHLAKTARTQEIPVTGSALAVFFAESFARRQCLKPPKDQKVKTNGGVLAPLPWNRVNSDRLGRTWMGQVAQCRPVLRLQGFSWYSSQRAAVCGRTPWRIKAD